MENFSFEPRGDGVSGKENCVLVVSGVRDDLGYCSLDSVAKTWYAEIVSKEVISQISRFNIDYLSEYFHYITISDKHCFSDSALRNIDRAIEISLFGNSEDPSVGLSFSITQTKWKGVWSIEDIDKAFDIVDKNNDGEAYRRSSNIDGYIARWDFDFGKIGSGIRLSVAINDYREIINKITSDFENAMESLKDGSAVISYFNFPDNVRSSCEQYLLYFTQFLRDLGIDANGELRECADLVMFSVSPRDDKEALHRIRSALSVYLSLPANTEFNSGFVAESDIAVMQLRANVQHLNTQLMLVKSAYERTEERLMTANAINELKNVSMQLLEKEIEALKIAHCDYFVTLPAPSSNSEEEKEKIFGGVVTLGQFEKFGIKVDFAKLCRSLKRK